MVFVISKSTHFHRQILPAVKSPIIGTKTIPILEAKNKKRSSMEAFVHSWDFFGCFSPILVIVRCFMIHGMFMGY